MPSPEPSPQKKDIDSYGLSEELSSDDIAAAKQAQEQKKRDLEQMNKHDQRGETWLAAICTMV